MNEFYEMKGIRREFSVARTPQQNGVAERKNRTLIEAARTMLADHLVFAGNQTNGNAGPKNLEDEVADEARKKNGVNDPAKEGDMSGPREATTTNGLNTVSLPVNVDANGNSTYRMFTHVNAANDDLPTDPLMPDLEDTADLQDTSIFGNAYNDEDVGAEADL
ncbi:putative ribonuclease H-like domain-containing protein, partial [Tanacetum coccineum]